MKYRSVLYSVIIFWMIFGFVQKALAHGEGQTRQLSQVPIGAYNLSVWTAPSYLRAGEIHFAAAINDNAQNPVTNCTVEILLTPLDEQQQSIHLLARDATAVSGYQHEIEHNLQTPGRYAVTVSVFDQAMLAGTAVFDIEITPTPPLMQILIYLSIGLVLLAALLLLSRGFILFGHWQPTHVQRPNH